MGGQHLLVKAADDDPKHNCGVERRRARDAVFAAKRAVGRSLPDGDASAAQSVLVADAAAATAVAALAVNAI